MDRLSSLPHLRQTVMKQYNEYKLIDTMIINIDHAIRTLFSQNTDIGSRPAPGSSVEEVELQPASKLQAARLMRVNHTGEVCAQALYKGQALTVRINEVRDRLEKAAKEENDHLAWCEERLRALKSRTSILNPLFYAGAFTIGALAGKVDASWGLGFIAETEYQVVQHLTTHLQLIPHDDYKSRAILEKMREEEAQHATNALIAGGIYLPSPVRLLMQGLSKIMIKTTYWI